MNCPVCGSDVEIRLAVVGAATRVGRPRKPLPSIPERVALLVGDSNGITSKDIIKVIQNDDPAATENAIRRALSHLKATAKITTSGSPKRYVYHMKGADE